MPYRSAQGFRIEKALVGVAAWIAWILFSALGLAAQGEQALDFAGVKVVVTGTLDKTSMTIDVKDIATAPGVQNTVQWGEREILLMAFL